MPKLNQVLTTGNNLETFNTGGIGTFQFSAARPQDLGAPEYTLASIVIDVTGSVAGFEAQLLQAWKTCVDACKKAPRADNLLLRTTTFNGYQGIQELHGFMKLQDIDTNNYKLPSCTSNTNLFDATYEAIESMCKYAQVLTGQDFFVNGACYIITDGENNNSKFTTNDIMLAIENAKKGEVMESLHAALIGINDQYCRPALEAFQRGVGMQQYVSVDNVTAGKLAKLAAFVSKSISSQSQALGTGQASQNLVF